MSGVNRPDGYSHILIDADYNHGEPSIDSGFTVRQVAQLLNADYSVDDISDRLGAPEHEVAEAVTYYEEHTREIDALMEEQEQVAEEYRPDYM